MINDATLTYPDEHLTFDCAYMRYLIEQERDAIVVSYIEQNFKEESFAYELNLMLKFPFFANKVLDDYELANDRKIQLFMRKLMYSDGGGGRICLIDGAKGGGKTGIGCFILDEYHKNFPKLRYYFVTKSENKPPFPEWIHIVQDIESVPNNSIALIDEGGIQLSSRRSMTKYNQDASDRLIILRHKGITLIILVQNVLMVDINVRRLADVRVLKYGVPFGVERKRAGEPINKDLELLRTRLKPRNNREAYIEIVADKVFLKFTHDLPLWWDDEKISKSYKYTNMGRKAREVAPKPRFASKMGFAGGYSNEFGI